MATAATIDTKPMRTVTSVASLIVIVSGQRSGELTKKV